MTMVQETPLRFKTQQKEQANSSERVLTINTYIIVNSKRFLPD